VPFLGAPPEKVPRAVIFDIGRVIIRVDLSGWSGTLGGPTGRSHEELLREIVTDPRWPDWEEGRIDAHSWHQHVCEKFQLALDFDEFCAIWNSVLCSDTILPDTLFEQLATQCRLALLSNTDPLHVAHFEANYSFVRHFPARVYSCRVGCSKPAPEIYRRALGETGAAPGETMFIDDLRENAAAAASLGIHAFHFISAGELLSEFSRLGLWTAQPSFLASS
jgi:putative hydrolase of the HAD superfamily